MSVRENVNVTLRDHGVLKRRVRVCELLLALVPGVLLVLEHDGDVRMVPGRKVVMS